MFEIHTQKVQLDHFSILYFTKIENGVGQLKLELMLGLSLGLGLVLWIRLHLWLCLQLALGILSSCISPTFVSPGFDSHGLVESSKQCAQDEQ